MKYKITGGQTLTGTIDLQGSKNSALALLAAVIITRSKIAMSNIPQLEDVKIFLAIASDLSVAYHFEKDVLFIDATKVQYHSLNETLVKKIRASTYFLSILSSLSHSFSFAESGGCKLGPRPLNYHLYVLERFNIKSTIREDLIEFHSNEILPSTIDLPYPSFGATVNAILLASRTKGVTTISNHALEPEIKCLCAFLTCKGVDITWLEDTLIINGVEAFKQVDHFANIRDRIAATTYLILGLLIGKDLKIKGVNPTDILDILGLLDLAKIPYMIKKDLLTVSKQENSAKIFLEAEPFPGFSTDNLPLALTLFVGGKGIGIFKDRVYPSRTAYINEIIKFNANIAVLGSDIVVFGSNKLKSSMATVLDLRGGAALMLLALKIKGTSIIDKAEILSRGYENLLVTLRDIGAIIDEIE